MFSEHFYTSPLRTDRSTDTTSILIKEPLPHAQLEALPDLPDHRSGSSWLLASLALLGLFDSARFDPSGRLVYSHNPASSPAVAVLALLLLPFLPLGPRLIQRV